MVEAGCDAWRERLPSEAMPVCSLHLGAPWPRPHAAPALPKLFLETQHQLLKGLLRDLIACIGLSADPSTCCRAEQSRAGSLEQGQVQSLMPERWMLLQGAAPLQRLHLVNELLVWQEQGTKP